MNRKHWTKSEIARAVEMRAKKTSLAAIGVVLDRSPHAVAVKLSRVKKPRFSRGAKDFAGVDARRLAAELERRGWTCEPPTKPSVSAVIVEVEFFAEVEHDMPQPPPTCTRAVYSLPEAPSGAGHYL